MLRGYVHELSVGWITKDDLAWDTIIITTGFKVLSLWVIHEIKSEKKIDIYKVAYTSTIRSFCLKTLYVDSSSFK